MTEAEFQASVSRDIRAIVERQGGTAVELQVCWGCRGFKRVAIPSMNAVVWGTRTCTICAGTGVLVAEIT